MRQISQRCDAILQYYLKPVHLLVVAMQGTLSQYLKRHWQVYFRLLRSYFLTLKSQLIYNKET